MNKDTLKPVSIDPSKDIVEITPVLPTSKEIALKLKPFVPEMKKKMLCSSFSKPLQISWREVSNMIELYDTVAREQGLIDPPNTRKH